MKCNHVNKNLSDFLTGEISEIKRKEVQEHLTVCRSCREEVENLSAIWAKLEVLPEEQPSPELRQRFYATLDSYRKDLNKEKALSTPKKTKHKQPERWQLGRPSFQWAFALLLLVFGATAGYLFHSGLQRNTEISLLHQEVQQIRAMTEATLSHQESMNEQLQEAGWNTESLLFLLSNSAETRQNFAQSLADQTPHLVEIAMSFASQVNKL